MSALDNPVWSALRGPHAVFAQAKEKAARYPADVSIFAAVADGDDPQAWAELLALTGPGGQALVALPSLQVPAPWEVVFVDPGVQMIGDGAHGAEGCDIVALTHDDVPAMLELIQRTRPGPFLRRTIDLGTYLGIRRDGELVAMAGERMSLGGWTEISAVCTDVAYRGQGMATRLVKAVIAGIQARGDVPILHVAASNTAALRMYESLGFRSRAALTFALIQAPSPG